MTVIAIHLGPVAGGQLEPHRSVRAVAGHGLEGDRHFRPSGAAAGQALTLVEAEVVEELGLEQGATRRQLTVRGLRLNELVGKRFRIGEVECYGVDTCEPCRHLQELTRPRLIRDLVHRGGLRADIVSDGTIALGDPVTLEQGGTSHDRDQ